MKKYYVLQGETFQDELIEVLHYTEDFFDTSLHTCRLVKRNQTVYFTIADVKPAPKHLIVAARLRGEI